MEVNIKIILKTLALFLVSAGSLYGTFAGSVVSSFHAEYIENEGFPVGLTYGDGYVWISYPYWLITKRLPINGSIIASFYLEDGGMSLGWEERNKYLYNEAGYAGVYWNDSTTGSVIGSFPCPPGLTYLKGIDFFDDGGSGPIWVCQYAFFRSVWRLTTAGSVVASFDLSSWPEGPLCLAYDGDTPGGDYLFVGKRSAPSYVVVVNPVTFSIISSFRAPVANYGLADMSWDGRYLWILENGPESNPVGWVYRCVGYSFPAVAPASLGKIKALYR